MNRLLALLRLRHRDEVRADADLAGAIRARRDAQAAKEALARSDHAISTVPRPTSLPELLALRMQGVATEEVLAAAAEEVSLRSREELDARAARAVAAARRRSVQRVVERRHAEELLVARRAARRSLGELARLRAVQR